jgi:hypothetical protein
VATLRTSILVEIQLFSEDETSYDCSPVKNTERLLRFLGELFMKCRTAWRVRKVLKDVGNMNSNIVAKRRVINDM